MEAETNSPEDASAMAFGLHQVAHQTKAENVLPTETLIEVHNQDNTNIKHQNLEGETTEINPTNDTKEREKVPVSNIGELENKDDEKFKQEKAKETEEATEMKLLKTAIDKEEVQIKLLTPTLVHGDTNPISQQQTLHSDESEAINNAAVVEEPEQPETKDNIGIVKQEQADHQSEESSVQSVITNYVAVDEHVTSESSTKLSGDANIDEQKTVESHSIENLENQDAKQLTDVEITESETEGAPKEKALQKIAKAGYVRNKEVDESSQEERETEAEFTEKFNKEMQTPQYETEVPAEINTTNTEKQEEVLVSHAKETQGIKDDGKFDQEAKVIEEATKMQLLEEEVQTTLVTPAFVECDTRQIAKQQSVHNDESEVIDNGKKCCIPEIEHDRKYTVVEEAEQPETKDNVSIVKEERADHPSEESNYITEGPVTSQSSTKLSDDADEDEQTTVESRSVDNLENKDASEIIAEEVKEAKQSTDVDIPKSATKGVLQDRALQTIPNIASIRNEVANESHQEERPPEAELTEKFKKEVQTPQYDTEETAKTNTTNDTDQEDTKGTAEATKSQLLKEVVHTTLPTPTFVQGDTDQISQPQTLHDDKSEVIDNAKSCIPEIEYDGKSTFVEEPKQPETRDNNDTVKEEQASHHYEESSVQSVITNYITAEGHVITESSTKLTDDADIDEQNIVESSLMENLENQDAREIIAKEATDVKQSTDVGIIQLKTGGVHEDKALETILDKASVRNEAEDETSNEEKQPEVEFIENFNEEVQTPQNDTEETAEINTINDTEKQEEVPVSHAKQKLRIEDDGKFDQEVKGIEVEPIVQLPEEEVRNILPIADIAQGDTDQIPQKQTLDNDESEVIDIAKNIGTPENELGGKSTVVEEPEQPELKDNIGEVKEEQTDHQSEESSVSSVINNYTTAEGQVTSEGQATLESSSKLNDDVDVDEQKIIDTHLVENLENRDACEITAEQATAAKQSTDVEIPKSKAEAGVHEEKDLQTILDEASVGKEAFDESSQEERQPEAEITEEFNQEVQTPQNDTEEIVEIKSTNDEKQEEVPASHANKKLEIQNDGKFNQEEKGIEEAIKMQLPEDEIQTTLPTAVFVQGDTNQIPQQLTLHDDESKAIDMAKNICMQEIELGKMFTVVEERGQPETKDNIGVVKEKQVEHQSEESSKGRVTSESSTLTYDVYVDEQKIEETHLDSVEDLENKEASEITAEQVTDSKQFTDLGIPKSETKALVRNEAVDGSSQEETQLEAELTEKFINEHTPEYVSEEAAEINTTNDTEEQEEIRPYHAKEKLAIEDDDKFDQEEAKGIEEATKKQLPRQGDTDQIPQETLHDDESEVIDRTKKSCIQEIEHDGMSTDVEEPEQPETNKSVGVVNEEQADHQSEDSSVPSVITNYMTEEGHVTSECSTKLTNDVEVAEEKTVDSCSIENLENKDASEITAEEATDAKQSTYVEIPKSETKDAPEDKDLPTILEEASVRNKTFHQSSQEERQPETEFTERISGEVETPQYVTEETAEININNDTKKQEEVPESHAKEKLEIEDDAKFDQEEAKGIEEATKTQLPEEEVQKTLPTAAFVQGDTNQILQEQMQHGDETEPIDTNTPEIKIDRKSTVEEPEQPETKDNISIVNQEAPDYASEESSFPTVHTNYITSEGNVKPESNTKFTDAINADEQKRSADNLENKDTSEITEEQATDANQSTDEDIQKSEPEDAPEDKDIQTLLDEASVGNKTFDESSQEERQPEELTEMLSGEVETPLYVTEETSEINTTNDTKKLEVVPESDGKENLEIEDDAKFNQEEAKGIEEATKTQLPEEQVQKTLPTNAFVQGDTNQILQEQTQHGDETEAIDTNTPEIKIDRKSTAVEEPEQPETKDNVSIVKEEQELDYQSEEASVLSVITNYTPSEGHAKPESNTKFTDEIDVDEQKHSADNSENRDTREITEQQATDAKQSTDVEIQKSETEEDKALQTILDESSVGDKTFDESSQEERQPEEELSERSSGELETPLYFTDKTAEINTTNDTKKLEEVPESEARENLEIQDDAKFDQEEAKGIEEVQTTLPTAAFVQGDTDQILQGQTLHGDETQGIDINTPEIQIDGKSTAVEEPEQPETKDNVSIIKEEEPGYQSEESSCPSVITSYTSSEGHAKPESITKFIDEINVDEKKRSANNLQNIDAREITEDQATDAKQSTDEEIQKSETEDAPEDKALQTILDEASVGNKTFDVSSQEERKPELEFTERFGGEVETPQCVTEEMAEINNNNTKKQKEVPESDVKEKLDIDDDAKFDQEELRGIGKATKAKLPEGEDQTTLPTAAFVQGDTDQILQGQTLHGDETEAIDISTPEIKIDKNFTAVEEPEQSETMDNATIIKEEEPDYQSGESSVPSVITNYTSSEGHAKPKSKTIFTDEIDIDEQKHSVDNLEIIDTREITEDQATDAKQSTDVEIQKSETEDVPEDKALQTILEEASVRNKTFDEEERQPESEFTERFSGEVETPQYVTEVTAEINTTNETKKQEEDPESDTKEKLDIEDDGKFNQEEAKGIEEATKTKLPEEEVQTTLPTAAFVQGDTDQILQGQTLHDDETEAIDINTPESKIDEKSTGVEELEQPETKDNISIVKEEEEPDYQSEESSVPSVIMNYTSSEGHAKSESNTKFTDEIDVDEQNHSDDNLENIDAREMTEEQETDAKQCTDVEIQKSETEGESEDKALQTILIEASVRNNEVDESSPEERQPEVEITKMFNEEVHTQQNDTEETAEINTTNDTEKQEEVPVSHTKVKLGIKDGGKLDQEEAKEIEEATKMQLPDEEVQTTLTTPFFVQGDTDQIPQQQTQYSDESETLDIAKKICTPEIELGRKPTVVEEPEQLENKDNISIVKEEQADHQSEESSLSSAITTYTIVEGHVTSESSTKLTNDVDVDEHKTEDLHKVENIENKHVSEITAEQVTDAKQSTDVEIPKPETEGEHEEKALQTILNEALVGNEAFDDSSQAERPPGAEFTEKFNKEVQTPQNKSSHEERHPEAEHTEKFNKELKTIEYDKEETSEINTINDTEKQEEIPVSHAKQKLGIADDGKFNQEEAKGIEAASIMQLPGEEVQTTIAFVQGDTDQMPQQQKIHNVESEAIDIAKNICTPEIELDGKSTVVEEPEQPETTDNVGIVKEEQANHQSEESSVLTVITNYTTEGHITPESTTKLTEDVDVDEQKTVQLHSVENLENKYASEITAKEATDGKQLTDMVIQKTETKGVPQDIALQTILHEASDELEAVDQSSQEARQSEAKFTEKFNEEEQTPQYDTEETAEINTSNDTEKQEEAKRIEETTKTQLLKEVQTTLPTLASVQGNIDQILQQQTLHDDESVAIDNAKKTLIPAIELDEKSTVIKEPEQPETKANTSIVKEQADHQSEESSFESVITNYITAEGQVTSESSKKLSDDVENNEQKTVESRLVEFLDNKDASKIRAEGTDSKQLTDVEIQKSESVPEDKALQTIPNSASVRNDASDECSKEEKQPQEEHAVTYTKDVQTPHYEFEVQKNIPEEPDQPETKASVGIVKEEQSDNQSQGSSMQSVITNYITEEGHLASESSTRLSYDGNEQKTVNLQSVENKDASKITTEEATDAKQLTDVEIQNLEIDGVPEDEVQATLPTSTIVKGEIVEGIVQEQTLEEEESAAIDNNSGRPQNELEQMANIVETIDQHETMAKVRAENEEHANHHSEQSSMENVITKHINSEGMVTKENTRKSSYDVEELEKVVLESNSIGNLEIKDGRKILPEEASDMKEVTDVPEDKAISTFPTIPSVKVDIVEESIQEVIQREAESAVTNTKEEQRPENNLVKNMEVLEALDLHKASSNTSVENEKNVEVRSEAKSQEIIIKHLNLEGQETAEISPSNDTKELEKEHEVTTGVSESVFADITEQTDTQKPETQETETTQLSSSTKEDEAGDEFEKISPSSSVSVISRDSQDTDTKVSHKKSHSILSGVGSKVKHSISKVKKAITGKSSHPKTPPSSK